MPKNRFREGHGIRRQICLNIDELDALTFSSVPTDIFSNDLNRKSSIETFKSS